MIGKKCKVEVFSRVTGFYRPVQSWNKGKTEEFSDRNKYGKNIESREEVLSGRFCAGALAG